MKVLVAVDISDVAEKAFDWYVDNIYKEADEIVVCHECDHPKFPIVSGFPGGAPAVAQADVDRIVVEHQESLNQLGKKYARKCENKQVKHRVLIETTSDSHGHAIVKKAEAVGAEMIVLGSHGHGALKRTILGSTTNYVLHHAKVPVLIYHK